MRRDRYASYSLFDAVRQLRGGAAGPVTRPAAGAHLVPLAGQGIGSGVVAAAGHWVVTGSAGAPAGDWVLTGPFGGDTAGRQPQRGGGEAAQGLLRERE